MANFTITNFPNFETVMMEAFDEYFTPKMSTNPLFLKCRKDFKDNIKLAYRLSPDLDDTFHLMNIEGIGLYSTNLLWRCKNWTTANAGRTNRRNFTRKELDRLIEMHPMLTAHNVLLQMYATLDNK